ncbi:Hypothetical predicted protein [Cloeon dipterum]|uniref:Bax inhibitor 1 n=1 Tax=Cloeon dipterum TaxID=197152 RepID=A0A8S1D0Z0_9INSE|nr:Hypothetical predicted protein [Cloeon dipterum]
MFEADVLIPKTAEPRTDHHSRLNQQDGHPVRTEVCQHISIETRTTSQGPPEECLRLPDCVNHAKRRSCLLGAVGLLIGLMATRNSKQNQPMRMGMLAALAYCIGTNLVPLLDSVLKVDPSIVVTALLSTSVVFVSFSMCALLAERGKWLFLGAPLLSLMNVMLLLLTLSIFTGTYAFMFNANVYLGLLAMCGFVLFDTQLIVEKRLMGDDDYIGHSVDLFIDLVGIFRRLLIILTKKEQDSRNKNKRE